MITFEQIHRIEQMTQDDWYEILKKNSAVPSCISHIKAKGITEHNGSTHIVLHVDLEDSEGNICRENPVFVYFYDVV